MRELVMCCWTVFAEDEMTNYEIEVSVVRQENGGFDVVFSERHCGKSRGCFWTPLAECRFEMFDSYREAVRYARDNIEEARYDGNYVIFNCWQTR